MRGRHAAVVLLAVAASFLIFQPLRSPWWSGYDYDSVYVGTGLTLFRGDRSNFYDHPGAPLQEGLGAIFTGAWLFSGDTRGDRADRWASNLDTTRPYLRTFASLIFLLSVLIAFVTIAWVTRSAWWGLIGGLLFLTSPDLITWAAVVKPDPLLAALAVACIGLLVEAFRRRSGALYAAAAFVLGFDLSVKVQAVGLAAPLVLAALWRPPPNGWWREARRTAASWLRAHRRPVTAAGCVWLAVVVVLNLLSAPPEAKPLAELAGGTAALAAVSAVAWRVMRRTRAAGVVSVAIACVFALLAGIAVPSLFYASVPAPTVRQMAITLTGGGVNAGAHPAANAWTTLGAWHVLLILAALGLAFALVKREWEAVLWASGGLALGFLAYLRFGDIHYYTAAIAVAAPLAVRALQAIPVWRVAIAALLCAAAVYKPYDVEIKQARGRGTEAKRTERVNEWVAARLPPHTVALTSLEASDKRIFHLVDFYMPWEPPRDYRFLPPTDQAARYVRARNERVAYLISGSEENATVILKSLGFAGSAERVRGAPGFVYRVT